MRLTVHRIFMMSADYAVLNQVSCSSRAVWIRVMVLLVWIHPMCLLVYQSKSYSVHTMCLLVTKVSSRLTVCRLVTKSYKLYNLEKLGVSIHL